MEIKKGKIVKHKQNKSIAIVQEVVDNAAYCLVTKASGEYEKGDNVLWLVELLEILEK